MAKSNLDERQKQQQTKSGNRAFWVMVVTSLIIQYWDLFFSDKIGSIGARGVNIVFLAGMLVYIFGNMKEGIWDTKMPAGIKSSLLVSFCGSGMMTIAYWAILIIRKKPGDNIPVNKMAGICFLICFAVIFIIYFLCGYLTVRREKKNLEKYLDD